MYECQLFVVLSSCNSMFTQVLLFSLFVRIVPAETPQRTLVNLLKNKNLQSHGAFALNMPDRQGRQSSLASCDYCRLNGRPSLSNTYCLNPTRSDVCGRVFQSRPASQSSRSAILQLHNQVQLLCLKILVFYKTCLTFFLELLSLINF